MRPSQNSPADAAETELSGAVAGASGAQHSRKDERDQSKGEEASHARSRASWDEDPTTSRGDDSAADSHSTGARAGAGPVSESTRHAARLSEDDDGGARVHRGAQALSGAEPERASGADKDGAALAAGVSGEEKEAEEYAEQIDFRKVGLLFAIPSNILMYAQSIPGCVPWGAIPTPPITSLPAASSEPSHRRALPPMRRSDVDLLQRFRGPRPRDESAGGDADPARLWGRRGAGHRRRRVPGPVAVQPAQVDHACADGRLHDSGAGPRALLLQSRSTLALQPKLRTWSAWHVF